ncbi:MAG: hypothetical protein ACM3ZC_05720 [Bacteroidota bacterium]
MRELTRTAEEILEAKVHPLGDATVGFRTGQSFRRKKAAALAWLGRLSAPFDAKIAAREGVGHLVFS